MLVVSRYQFSVPVCVLVERVVVRFPFPSLPPPNVVNSRNCAASIHPLFHYGDMGAVVCHIVCGGCGGPLFRLYGVCALPFPFAGGAGRPNHAQDLESSTHSITTHPTTTEFGGRTALLCDCFVVIFWFFYPDRFSSFFDVVFVCCCGCCARADWM